MPKNKVLSFINSAEYSPMTIENISIIMQVPKEDLPLLSSVLNELEVEGFVIKGKKNRYFSTKTLGFISGVFRATTKGFGFVSDGGKDVLIPYEYTLGALDGDKVLIKKIKAKSYDKCGEVVRILERSTHIIVGIFKDERTYGIVVPDDEKLPREIFVASNDFNGALNGQKVVCSITSFESHTSSLCCKVDEILGFPYDFGVDVLSLVKRYGFNTTFPQRVEEECKNISFPAENELTERLDLTDKTVITIDGADTKDIDDAISIEKTDFGYTLGVHIADVSHYVKENSPLDKEAFARGTSVYLADRVIPMLPPVLSNGLCSLNEGELRLTMSVFIDFDNHGNIQDSRFFKSFIKSCAKMTYDDVYSILKSHPSVLCKKYSNIINTLETMYSLYHLLSERTRERGAIDFNIPESKAVLDSNGKTVDIVLRESNFSHKMIEEFMVRANSVVSEYLWKNKIPSVYRIHEEPNDEKLANAFTFMYNNGYGHFESVNKALAASQGEAHQSAISTMLLKSMAKAKYSPSDDGHYGLMLENYCHFTSPIRRYPDLICHRALKSAIEKDNSAKKRLGLTVGDAAEQSSTREQDAAMCERDVLDIKKAEYMQSFIGENFEGVISSVTNFGFFVILPNTVEGLVRAENLYDDYYELDEKNYALLGKRTKRAFTLGDTVEVKLASANKITGKIEFLLSEGGMRHGGKGNKKTSRPKQNGSSRVFHKRKNRSRH